ncbi:MAG TPA: NAD-binding protein [Rectinemataceae bacterium]|nr:NAD-binding protein [Rectinemataceae bacterium]
MDRVIVIGAGKVGYHLAKVLNASHYEVMLVERDGARGSMIAEKLEVKVFCGDGSDLLTLKDAGAEQAMYLVAVTGSDADNLVACQIAKEHFHVPHTIARAIDPNNERLFRSLGVDAVISTTALAATTIGNVLPSNGLRLTSIFDRGDVELAEVDLDENSPVVGQPVSELRLPEDCLLVAILRGDSVSLPRGRSVLQPRDRVFAVARRSAAPALRRALMGGKE